MSEYYNLYKEDTSEYQEYRFKDNSTNNEPLPGFIEHRKGRNQRYKVSMIVNEVVHARPDTSVDVRIWYETYQYNTDGVLVRIGSQVLIEKRRMWGGPFLIDFTIGPLYGNRDTQTDFIAIKFSGDVFAVSTGYISLDYKHVQVNYAEDDFGWDDGIITDGLLDISKRYSPRTQSNGIGIYQLNQNQLIDFFKDLWSISFTEKFFYKVLGDPIESIISLRYYFGIKDLMEKSTDNTYVTIGNVSYNGVGTESILVTKPVIKDYAEVDMGEVKVPEYHNNFLDNAPYTDVEIYVPFYGYYSMNATEVMGNQIRLIYYVNVTTGTAIANIYRLNPNGERYFLITSLQCDLGIDIPISVNAMESLSARLTSKAVGLGASAIGMAATATMGPAGAVMGSMVQQQTQTAVSRSEYKEGERQQARKAGEMVGDGINNVMNPTEYDSTKSSRHSGMGAETGSMSDFMPALYITRPIVKAPANYNKMVGMPDYSSGKIGDYEGYIKVGSISNGAHDIPRSVYDEIVKNLRGGVYVN